MVKSAPADAVASTHTSPDTGDDGVVVPVKIRLPVLEPVAVSGCTLIVPAVPVLVPIPTKSI